MLDVLLNSLNKPGQESSFIVQSGQLTFSRSRWHYWFWENLTFRFLISEAFIGVVKTLAVNGI